MFNTSNFYHYEDKLNFVRVTTAVVIILLILVLHDLFNKRD